MNKKIILTLGAMSLSFAAQANWYAGVNLGIDVLDTEKKLTYPLDDPQPTYSRFRNSSTNFHGQLTAGFQLMFDQMGLALEGNADWYTGKSTYKINNWFFSENVRANERLRYGFGLFLLPTYQVNPYFRLFAGPGVNTSQFRINFRNTAGNVGVSTNDSEWLTAWAIKVGTSGQIANNTELVFTYQFAQYERVTWSRVEPLSGDVLRGRYRPNVNLFMLGLKYSLPDGAPAYVK
ncbi:Uncharacterised protein [Legionella beliardensis]|uniref:Outer membrane protein beta-barrel domain-containing protein n=1 Tax=Legionella beliardensis TaxID=91822 RepID=A0A378I025_9GAMM|nr:outer membrane beta-barrel protein [Legionella beliardensis]STX28548.1 Uncharacterised protein [Legionella beliardensis]